MKYGVDLRRIQACNQSTSVLGGDGGDVYTPTVSLLENLGHDR